ncbi:glycosyltransferase family 2 protein [Mesorhizobium sp. M7A.F.Ca.CA.001.14.1.1]|uniref:glycosyltransferase family 2 protein n=1 Tax=Mesorhizobium sp. M7A.F.Ca.CA.001.14.1.1 TaxID=2496706 RepID=UPI000FD427DF|nr:glycosyltransferase family 2 protein [Mesorhizobium sp. M7A.F.Ca.CA.001.14.1.1]RUZ90285.1 glycosyltransferase family 2 protein [Mesorhizobium sp. M7A.F.Ca.CA.001.14.1.1]
MNSSSVDNLQAAVAVTQHDRADVSWSRPFISVGIPTFRRPDTIRRAIDSVLGQDYSDWELVVSDDEGPEGETWAIVTDYARSEPRIRIIENSRGRGQVENTNNAMLACSGRWIKLLHDDDWLAPGALRTLAEVAKQHPSVAFMTSAANIIEDKRVRFRQVPKEQEAISLYSSQQCLMDLYLVRATRCLGIIPSTLLINSDVIRAGCLMRTHKEIPAGVDQLFFVDLASHGDMVAISDPLTFYDATSHPSITTSKSFREVDEVTLAVKQLNWNLIKDRNHLPPPETLLRALRVARIPMRFHQQSWLTTFLDGIQIFRPSVMKVAGWHVLNHVFAIRPRLGRVRTRRR